MKSQDTKLLIIVIIVLIILMIIYNSNKNNLNRENFLINIYDTTPDSNGVSLSDLIPRDDKEQLIHEFTLCRMNERKTPILKKNRFKDYFDCINDIDINPDDIK